MRIIGLDTETTGLDATRGDRIIEFGASIYDRAGGAGSPFQLRAKICQRINPQREIDPGAERVHGISLMDLRGKPTWKEAGPKIIKLVNSADLIVAHNAEFDVGFLIAGAAEAGMSLGEWLHVFCTMENGRGATALGKKPSLKELCFAMGVEYRDEDAHSATYDVDVMMASYFRGVERGFFDEPKSSRREAAA